MFVAKQSKKSPACAGVGGARAQSDLFQILKYILGDCEI